MSLSSALAHRSHLLTEKNQCCRLIDGAADGFPELFLDQFGPHWLVSTRHRDVPTDLINHANSQNISLYHKALDQDQKRPPQWLCGNQVEEPFVAQENGRLSWIDFQSGYSQGIFLDQRNNRDEVQARASETPNLLNTFAYTGAFSIAGALGGSTTTTLDLSQPYLDWAKRNFTLNQIDPATHYFCKGDTLDWLRRFAKSGRRFDGIILDPPTFSRDAKGKVWSVAKNLDQLLELAKACLVPGGWIFVSTNCRKLEWPDFMVVLGESAPEAEIQPTDLPEDFPDEPYLKAAWLNF